MSRIYQGGGADRRFQSNKQSRGFNPTQVKGEIKRIQQEGQAAIRDLQTQDRERGRANQMADLERNAADRFAQAQLRQEQIQESAAFRIQQTVDNYELRNSQEVARNSLRIEATVASNKLNNQQRVGRNTLTNQQLAGRNRLTNQQQSEKNELQLQQFADASKFQLQQMGEKALFENQQLTERNVLKNEQLADNLELGLKGLALTGNAKIQQAQMQADNASANAALAKQQAGVNALMSFAGIALKGAELGVQLAEQQDREAQKEADLAAFDSLFEPSSVNVVTRADTAQNAIEIADEQAIQSTGANSIQREHMRQPLADQTMLRDIRQTEIGAAANQFQSQFDSYINDPNTRAMVNGEMRALNSLNDQELTQWLTSAARDLTAAYGITGKEGYASVMQYGRAVQNSINAQYNSRAAGLRKLAKSNRWDAVTANATEAVVSGDLQRANDLLFRGVYSSGMADNMTVKEAKEAAFNRLVEITPTDQLEQLKNVNSIAGQANTQYGKQRVYAEKIDTEITRRNNAQYSKWNSGQNLTSMRIKTIEQTVQMQLFEAGADGDARSIREAAIEQLRPLGPQAYDAINRLQAKGGENPSVLAELNEAFDNGNPPSTAAIADAHNRGAISTAQKDALLKRGKTSSQIAKVLTSSGLPSAEKMLGSAASAAMGTMNIPSDQQSLLKDTVVNAELANYKNELNRIIINNPDAPASVIQQKVQELNVATQKRLFDPSNQDASVFQKDGSIYTYKFGSTPRLAPYRINESTGKAHRSYINHTVEQIAKPGQGASVNDAYLTKDQFLTAVEVWDRGGSDYSPRIKAISKHLGISPSAFIRKQSEALGFGSIDRLPDDLNQLDSSSTPPSMKQGFQALQSMGFPSRGAAYLAGNIQQESGWNGGRTWGEVMNDGSDRNGGLVSWMDDAQRNHFRLRNIEQYLGKSINEASTSEQLQAMVWEMKKRNPSAYRAFMNPNSTDIQLRRASREYWGYGHEGSRYSYAQSLL